MPALGTLTPTFLFFLLSLVYACRNGGTPLSKSNLCACTDDFKGEDCGIRKCLFGHWNGTDQACVCDYGWEGGTCSVPGLCEHGRLEEQRCICEPNWEGGLCNIPKCYNNATLDAAKRGCECSGLHAGFHCNDLCSQSRHTGEFQTSTSTCLCVEGFAQPACVSCTSGYYPDPKNPNICNTIPPRATSPSSIIPSPSLQPTTTPPPTTLVTTTTPTTTMTILTTNPPTTTVSTTLTSPSVSTSQTVPVTSSLTPPVSRRSTQWTLPSSSAQDGISQSENVEDFTVSCTSSLCRNGTCDGRGMCACLGGWEGRHCEEEIICSPGGVLSEDGRGCECGAGWSPPRCQQCRDGYAGERCLPVQRDIQENKTEEEDPVGFWLPLVFSLIGILVLVLASVFCWKKTKRRKVSPPSEESSPSSLEKSPLPSTIPVPPLPPLTDKPPILSPPSNGSGMTSGIWSGEDPPLRSVLVRSISDKGKLRSDSLVSTHTGLPPLIEDTRHTNSDIAALVSPNRTVRPARLPPLAPINR